MRLEVIKGGDECGGTVTRTEWDDVLEDSSGGNVDDGSHEDEERGELEGKGVGAKGEE